jgi:hypothetical protein
MPEAGAVMGFGTELFETIEKARAPLLGASRRLVSHRLFPLGAPEWMVNQFHVIRATSMVLEFAWERSPAPDFGRALTAYYKAKTLDEGGHDALMLQDLESIGKRKDAEASPTDPDIAAWVGSQLYLAQFEHPAAYLGFIAVLEAFPPTVEEIEAWGQAAGLPREALSCALLHAKADIGHREDLRAILDATPETLRPLIERNALQCMEYQRQAILTLCRKLDALQHRVSTASQPFEEHAHG